MVVKYYRVYLADSRHFSMYYCPALRVIINLSPFT